ncbi:Nitrogen fixation protein NifQ, molybdenum ion binding [Paraburkholderia ribeironis]|uniref:Nitrogen fixation protein NifQ, molybdenum ion binding n=1 Tax=Paraburkholderia ribeironis TaxID=1247936 RepID=A0A1N7S8F2_9BURK|nr:nitrogen fixation protein NifQ [Paraburkholderia ribeironis]SIT43600.1 Nitrogen fixation protein NifQ, molybdenum ion binding [Paraburkholderia ribeironis]
MATDFHATLMRHAIDANDSTVLALAGVLSAAFDEAGVHTLPIRGLDADETRWLLARWFPGVDSALSLQLGASTVAWRRGSRYDDVEEIVALFKAHAEPCAGTTSEVHCISHALACACVGKKHLWQDLRLPSRSELSALLGYWFPRLAEKNVHGMKWKKFLYKQLCEREALIICKASNCADCADFADCFGPE